MSITLIQHPSAVKFYFMLTKIQIFKLILTKALTLSSFKHHPCTSLVVQWLRIFLPAQATWVRSLVWEDPTCLNATNCLSPNALEPVRCNKRSHCEKKPEHHN